MAEAVKGLAYVLVTTILLCYLCRSWSHQVAEAWSRYKLSQSQHALYVKNSPVAISVVDQRGNFIATNQATHELTGYDAGEVKESSIFDLVIERDLEDTQQACPDSSPSPLRSRISKPV